MFSLLVCKFFVFKDAHTSSIAKAGTEEAIRKSKISESQFEKGLTYMIFDIIKGASSLKSYKDLIFKIKKIGKEVKNCVHKTWAFCLFYIVLVNFLFYRNYLFSYRLCDGDLGSMKI